MTGYNRFMSFRRVAVIGSIFALLSALVVVSGISSAARVGNPQLALTLSPIDSRALEGRIDQLIRTDAGNRSIADARLLALRAVTRDPTSIVAVRTLALSELAQGNLKRGNELMDYALKLSRRDLPTTLYLIDRKVARDDIAGALHLFDTAMQTSEASRDILYPILYEAITDDRLIDPMVSFFRKDQSWLPSFLDAALGRTSSAVNLSRVIARISSTKASKDFHLRQVVLNRLVNDGEYRAAHDYLLSLEPQGRARAAGHVRDSDFVGSTNLPPFDWVLESSSSLGAYRVASDDRQARGLGFYARGGQAGSVASQLMLLPPGQYRFQSIVGRGGRARWIVRCAAGKTSELLVAPFVDGKSSIANVFSVPADPACEAQWLRLEISGNDDAGEFEGLVNSIRISPEPLRRP